MRSKVFYTCEPSYVCDRHRKPYTFFSFLGDVLMTLLTSGLWLIWIFCREMRKPR